MALVPSFLPMDGQSRLRAGTPTVFFDTETWKIGDEGDVYPPRLVCGSYAEVASLGAPYRVHNVFSRERLVQLFWGWVRAGKGIVAHNNSFDVHVVLRAAEEILSAGDFFDFRKDVHTAAFRGQFSCTYVREKLIKNAFGHLKATKLKIADEVVVRTLTLAGAAVLKANMLEVPPSVWARVESILGETFSPDRRDLVTLAGALNRIKEDDTRTNFRLFEAAGMFPDKAQDYMMLDIELLEYLWRAQSMMVWTNRALFGAQYSGRTFGDVLRCEAERAYADINLHAMSVVGHVTDDEAVQRLKKHQREEVAAVAQELVAAGILRHSTDKHGNPTLSKNTAVIKAIIQSCFPEDQLRRTPTGDIARDRKVLLASGNPLLKKLASIGPAEKILSTYVPALERGQGGKTVHHRYNILVESGRTSAYDWNTQNLNKKGGVRECIPARPGKVFLSADYDSAEMRTFAEVCLQLFGRSRLAQEYNKDPHFDPHTLFASQRLGLSYAEGMRRKAAGDPVFLAERDRSKAANFGYPGGLGAFTFVSYAEGYGVHLTLDESTEIRRDWLRTWPEADLYFRYIKRHLPYGQDASKTVVQIGSGRVRGNCKYTQWANTLFQGLAADGAMAALNLISYECYCVPESPLYESRPVFFIHDEFVLETPEQKAQAASRRLVELMIQGMRQYVRNVPITAEAKITDRFTKKGSSTPDKFGNLPLNRISPVY